MEQNIQNSAENDRVFLQIPGIDKKWIRHNGSWVDKNSLPAVTTKNNEDSQMKTDLHHQIHNPWWKFWASNA